jgi:1,4-alpha-glucan branching enzyme
VRTSRGTRAGSSHPFFTDLVIYQLHVGAFFTPNLPAKGGTFLDVARKIPYLADLGVTAIQLMPIQEFQTEFSLGYNGTDYFSPEMDFAVDDAALPSYTEAINHLLDDRGVTRYRVADLRAR